MATKTATVSKKTKPAQPVLKQCILTIRIREDQIQELEELKTFFQVKASSKALLMASRLVLTRHRELINRNRELEAELLRAFQYIQRVKQTQQELHRYEGMLREALANGFSPQVPVSDASDIRLRFDDNDYQEDD